MRKYASCLLPLFSPARRRQCSSCGSIRCAPSSLVASSTHTISAQPHAADTRIVLGSSLAWLKVRSHFQMARSVREGILRDLWSGALVDPTPMQTCFPNPAGALFGTCWGDCAEAISLSACVLSLMASSIGIKPCVQVMEARNFRCATRDSRAERRVYECRGPHHRAQRVRHHSCG